MTKVVGFVFGLLCVTALAVMGVCMYEGRYALALVNTLSATIFGVCALVWFNF